MQLYVEVRSSDLVDFIDFVNVSIPITIRRDILKLVFDDFGHGLTTMSDICCPTISYTRHPISYLLHCLCISHHTYWKLDFKICAGVRYVVHALCHKTKLQILQCVLNWALIGLRNLGMWDAVMEFAETMAFIGLQIDLVLYLMDKLNFANTKAATTVTNFAGTAFICPLIGGFIADAYLGRFLTILVFGLIELVVSCLSCLA